MGSWKSPGFFLSVKEWEPCGGGIEKNDDDVRPSVGSGTVRIDHSVSWSDDDVQPSVGSGTVRIDHSVSWSDVVHSD